MHDSCYPLKLKLKLNLRFNESLHLKTVSSRTFLIQASLTVIELWRLLGLDDTLDHNSVSILQSWGVLPLEFPCPKCTKLMALHHDSSKADNFAWKCRKSYSTNFSGCNYSRSLRLGTYFASSKLPIKNQVHHVCLWTMDMEDSSVMIDGLGCFRNTSEALRQRCFEVVIMGLIRHTERIGGNGKFVQIIESKFGQQKYQRKQFNNSQWVYGGMEWGSGKCFFVPVSVRNKHELLHIIEKLILPETTLISYCPRAHKCLDDKAFIDLKARKSLRFLDPVNDSTTVKELRRRFKAFFPMCAMRKDIVAGDLAKTMFLKRSISRGTDAIIDYMKWAGELFNPKAQNI